MITPSDFLTIALLVALEGLLSADNAMVLAVLVLGLPKKRAAEGAALRHCRRVRLPGDRDAAGGLPDQAWVGEAGRRCVSAVPVRTTTSSARATPRRAGRRPKPSAMLGLTPFWSTVVKVELTDIVFAIDSILVAVAMSPKLWVVLTGGILGIVMMRLVIGTVAVDGPAVSAARRRRVRDHRLGGRQAARRVPPHRGYIGFEIPKWLSLGLIVVIFALSWWLARRQEARTRTDTEDAAAQLLSEEEISQ